MPEDTLNLKSHSPEETERLGRALMDLLPDGSVVALRGELGAGKTCLVRGMARALCGNPLVSSPTFTILHEYEGGRKLHHLDLYRITSPDELIDIGFEDLISDPPAVCVIEWAERAEPCLPKKRVDLTLEHAGGDTRTIQITNARTLPDRWSDTLQSAIPAD